MNRYLVYWWLAFCLQILAIATAIKFGLYERIIGIDPTHITTLIASLHVIATMLIGWSIWKGKTIFAEALYWSAQTQLGLGIVGTLAGFMMILDVAFGTGMGGDIEAIKHSISIIVLGLGISIRCTLLGIISNILINGQLAILETKIDDQTS